MKIVKDALKIHFFPRHFFPKLRQLGFPNEYLLFYCNRFSNVKHNGMAASETEIKEETKAEEHAKGLPTPPKQRMVYSCRICKKPQTKETGHSQYFGQTYCPNEPGQIPREEWLAKKSAERKAKKAAQK